MATSVLLCALLVAARADEAAPPEAIQKYLADCEAAKTTAIAAQQASINALGANTDPQTLKAAQAKLDRLQASPAGLLPMPLPPEKEGIGIFAPPQPGDRRGGRSVDVLEVVDEDDAILRVWYSPAPSTTDKSAPPEDPTFIDIWVHGVDTAGLKANKPATLSQVFQAIGTKTFGTTCGGRNMILLEPVDVERYRKATKQPAVK